MDPSPTSRRAPGRPTPRSLRRLPPAARRLPRAARCLAPAVWPLLLAALALLPGAARGQVVWDGPMMISPGTPAGWGLHLVEPGTGDGAADGVGGLFTWRSNPVPVGVGLRFGVTEGRFEDPAVLGGIDISGRIYRRQGQDFDMGVVWFAGAGFGWDDVTTLSLPVGLSVGWAFGDDGFALRPWIAPRMFLDAHLGDPEGVDLDEFDLGFAMEVGVDLAFDPRFGIRAAGSFVDREALSLGVTFPGFLR